MADVSEVITVKVNTGNVMNSNACKGIIVCIEFWQSSISRVLTQQNFNSKGRHASQIIIMRSVRWLKIVVIGASSA